MVDKKQNRNMFWIFAWLTIFLLNLVLLVIGISFVLFPHSSPLTINRLTQLSYFEDSNILDVHAQEPNPLFGQSGSDWILYRDFESNTRLVSVRWSHYVPRFRINEKTDILIPSDKIYYSTMIWDNNEQYEISIQASQIIDARCVAVMSNSQSNLWFYLILTSSLTLLEASIFSLVKWLMSKHKRFHSSTNY